jgi:homoserine O-acetyltransferase/O-succinyltransferase
MIIRALAAALLALAASQALAQTKWPNQREDDFLIKDFRFKSGETIAELKLHYTALGTPKRNAAGEITNAVILLHGTSSDGKAWLMPSLADELFVPGAPLDAAQYFIVLPDGIGRGGSSKPSDGLRAKFPHYRYDDIVASECRPRTWCRSRRWRRAGKPATSSTASCSRKRRSAMPMTRCGASRR